MFSGLRWDWVGKDVSLKHLPNVCLKQLIKTEPCVWNLFPQILSCGVEIHSEKRRKNKRHCTKWDSHILFARKKKRNKEWLVPAVFQDTRGKCIYIPVMLLRFFSQFLHLCRSSSRRHLFPCIQRHLENNRVQWVSLRWPSNCKHFVG